MWSLFFKKKAVEEKSYWKEDFSDCVALDYLPDYSICKCKTSYNCRYVARYSRVVLCSHPDHKSFIPEDSERFDPHKDLI